MYFAKRGQQGEGWIRHLDTIVPENGVVLHELHTVDNAHQQSSAFHDALHSKATERNTVVLPAGFYGEHTPLGDVPTFTPDEFLLLMPKSAKHLTTTTLKKYQELQSIREMRAVVGSLAWLAAHMGTHAAEYAAKPTVLWGRTHSASLPDMYQRLGIHTEVNHLDAPLRYTYLQPHGLSWSEQDLQNAFHLGYRQAIGLPDSAAMGI